MMVSAHCTLLESSQRCASSQHNVSVQLGIWRALRNGSRVGPGWFVVTLLLNDIRISRGYVGGLFDGAGQGLCGWCRVAVCGWCVLTGVLVV